jgi:penicillin-insensitive murein endopeptidase
MQRMAVAVALAVAMLVGAQLGRQARAEAPATLWSRFTTPSSGEARAIGGYSSGCIEGAVALPTTGPGFRVALPGRGRVYGHPALIGFLEQLGQAVARAKLNPLTVGDLGQPRGGPAPTGHASHQTGLDVDLWFTPATGANAVSMVDGDRPSPRFTPEVARLLELAAPDPRVDRIFVNPVLKRALCERAAGGDRRWLQRIRPWWGHADHFHVRLACPAGSPECVAQPALPPGDGCDTLAWWFDKKALAERAREHQSYSSRVGAAPELPERCRAMLASPSAAAPPSSHSMSAP